MTHGERNGKREEPPIERFLGDPTRELADWRWLWSGNHRFPIRSHRGLFGRVIIGFKRLLRPLVSTPQADLWERQRIFNLIALEYLQRSDETRRVVADSQLPHLVSIWRQAMDEVMEHNDALFARADQKLDRLRRETRELWNRLGAALAAAESGGGAAMAVSHDEHSYLEFEQRFRGTREEIGRRIEPYVERLRGRGAVLDLGCGRGEALDVLRDAGIDARGVESSAAMVAACRQAGLAVEHGDLFAALEATPPSTLGAVVSFHVIEHLPPQSLDRLVRLAWGALAPGGVLLLETPNPLSLVVAARNFWIDPTHLRPVHPATLDHLFRAAGFDPVERLELSPFRADERLPEIALDGLPEAAAQLAHEVNLLRDRLDDLLFGAQDYALLGTRPSA